jgi:cell division septal protein FtsQ
MSGRKELTRAELVRLRRTMENARRIEQAAREATRPIPPVSARARREIVRSKHRSAGSARRRFLSALHLPRVDVHSIHIPRPRFGWRLLSFLLAAVFAAAIYFAFERPELRVAQAQVTGNRLLDPAEVNAVLNVTGDPIFTLIPSDLETRLRLNYPEIVSVKVTISLPNLVFVDIVERQPIIRWEQAGAYTWIAEDGIAFRPRGEASGLITVNALSAPPVEGGVSADPLSPAPFISVEMVKALQRLVSRVPPGAPILYESNMGFGWDDPRGWRVHFGTSASEMELKMRVYEAMVDSLTQRGIRPALINVMYPTAPYYRMDQ